MERKKNNENENFLNTQNATRIKHWKNEMEMRKTVACMTKSVQYVYTEKAKERKRKIKFFGKQNKSQASKQPKELVMYMHLKINMYINILNEKRGKAGN